MATAVEVAPVPAPVTPTSTKEKEKEKDKGQEMIPSFLRKIRDDYKSKVAHVFIIHGNIDDFSDNSGNRHDILRTMAGVYDTKFKEDSLAVDAKNMEDKGTRGLDDSKEHEAIRGTQKIMASFSLSQGLEFYHPKSREAFEEFLTSHYKDQIKEWREDWKNPGSMEAVTWVLNKWFKAIQEVVTVNRQARKQETGTRKEVIMNVIFLDGDALFPHGDIAQLAPDRLSSSTFGPGLSRETIGDRNR
jgi:hypothetical protein